MQFNSETKKSTIYVRINGEVDNNGVIELMKQMRMLLVQDFDEVVFDLSNVPGITGATIGKFLMFYKNVTAKGKSMRIKGMNEGIESHFLNLRLNQLFPVEY